MDNDDHSAPPSPYPLVMAWPAGWRGCSSVFFLLSNLLELNLEGYFGHSPGDALRNSFFAYSCAS